MRRILLLISILVTTHCAQAASVTLIPLQSTLVVPGQTVAFDVVFDFADALGDGVLGGGFDIVFDASALAFTGLVPDFVADAQFFREPDVFDGRLESWGVATLSSAWPATGRFGTVSFTVLGTMGPTATIFGQSTQGIAGPFMCSAHFACIIDVEYNAISLTRVPLPPALLLFAGALLGLGALRRV